MRPLALLLAVLAVAAVALPAAAPAYPPITCGRTTVAGHAYVVRSHGPTCGFALRWARSFIGHHGGPKGYRCRAYGKSVPADCVSRRSKYSYFLATTP